MKYFTAYRGGVSYWNTCRFCTFSGCNLRCPFCDTQHEEGTLMSDEDIVMEVAKYSTR